MSKELNEKRIRNSDAFKILFEAYESGLQMKTDLMHQRIAAGLNHGLAITFQNHYSVNTNKNGKNIYVAPTLVGTGSNQYGQLGQLANQITRTDIDGVDNFEKIFLVHNSEEYYPIQVCCGYSFSLILAIEGKNLQWLEKLTNAKAEKHDKSDAQNIRQEQLKELLSRTKVFFSGRLGIHLEDNQEGVGEKKIDKRMTFLRSATKMKTRQFDFKNTQKFDIFQPKSLNTNQITIDNYNTENEALLGNQDQQYTEEDSQLTEDDNDDQQQTTIRMAMISEEQKNYKFVINDVVAVPLAKGVTSREGFVVQISCGMNFCLILTYNFRVYGWGDNSYGNIGAGDLDYHFSPTLIEFEENKGNNSKIQYISCGSNHSAAVSVTGKLYTWGQGIFGQLGHKNVMNQSIPIIIKGELEEKNIVLVSCGGSHTVCLTNEGYAYAWGNNKNGQLGLGDQEQRNIPQKLSRLQNYFIMNVICGMNNTFIFTQVGKIFACGSNQHNKLGLDQTIFSKDNYLNPIDLDTSFLKGIDKPKLKDVYVYQIASSPHFTYALSNKGFLTTWGLQVGGCLSRTITSYIQEKMSNANKHDTNMLIPCTSQFRKLPKNSSTDVFLNQFFPIQNLSIFRASEKDFISNEIVDIQLGTFHTMALTNAGEIYIWGSNQMGQHGCVSAIVRQEYEDLNEKKMQLLFTDLSIEALPSVVSFFNIKENRRITYIAAGYEYCMAIENKRLVYAWGRNTDGQLGIGKTQFFVDSPQMVQGLEGNLMKSIACGENHTLFLTDTGRVFSCGSPKDGKLGLGKRTNTQLQPQLIEGLQKVEQISCGQSHSMALAIDNFFQMEDEEDYSRSTNNKMVIYTWGNAWESKLGHGDRENLYEPTRIQSNYLFKTISAGSHHSAALTTDDNLVVWGPYKYFGYTKPDENVKGKKVVSSSNEYQEFLKPTLHPKITEKIRYVCLGDKTTFIIAKKDNKIQQYGLFETDFKEYKNKGFSNEHILEKILPYKGGGGDQDFEVPVNEINKLVVSKDHVAILGKNQVYTWGHDNQTGRLGHGYMFQDSKNSIDNMQPEEQTEVDYRQKPQYDLVKKIEKPEYCNYINKYLQEQLKNFQQDFQYNQNNNKNNQRRNKNYLQNIIQNFEMKKQQQGKEEDGEVSSGSEESGDEELSDNEGQGERKKSDKKGQTTAIQSPLPKSQQNIVAKRNNTVKHTMKSTASQLPSDFQSHSNIFNLRNQTKRKSTLHQTRKNTQAFITQQNFLANEKQTNQEMYQQYFVNPQESKSTFSRLMAKDKPDLYTLLIEPYGLLNEERILFVYDKVTSKQGEIFLKYQTCQSFLNNNKLFKRAAQSEILKRIASQPFNISYSDKMSYQTKQEHLLPFTTNKFYYIKLFTLLQTHPCYLIKIYEKKMDKDQFIQLVKETFGDLEGNKRKQRIYTEICKKILLIDLKDNKSFKDSRKQISLNSDKATSWSYVFVKLFLHFFESLSENIKLIRTFRLKLRKNYDDLIQSNSSKYAVQENMFVLDRKALDNNQYYKTDEQIKESLDKNQAAIKDYLQIFFKDTDFLSGYSTQNRADKLILTEKLRELIQFTFDYIQQKRPSEISENIQNSILNILFSCMLENCQSLCTEDKFGNNFAWICKALRMFIYLDENDKKSQDINNFIEYVKSQDDERSKIYKKLVGKGITKKSTASYDFITDIYEHSLDYSDDQILVSLSTIDKLTKFIAKTTIQFNPKEEEDFFLQCCKKIKEEQPNFVTSTVDKQFENQKMKIKLETRQLFYSSTQVLKKCSDCDTILQKDFLRSIDKDIKEQFLMFNPSSLEQCAVKMFQIINKQSFEDLMNGKITIQHLSAKFISKYTKDKHIPQNVQIVKNFSKAFDNAYELEYSNESQSEKLIIPSDLSKQVLKSLKGRLDNQINQVIKYYNKMETLYRVYHNIVKFLDSFLASINKSKSEQFKILTNSYYGIANRDLEKVIERDPIAITSKIQGSIHGMDLSRFLYENIDVFANRDLSKIKERYQQNQISDHFIKLNMFGEYSIWQLKLRGVIKDIDDEIVNVLEAYLPNQKKTNKKKKNLKSDIERCLFYIFNDFGDKFINVDVVYKGGEFSILTILCGLKGSKELRIDSFKIEREILLNLRKQRLREDLSKQTDKFGFTTFYKKGLLKILEKMEDHYSVYEYIYSSNNCIA